MELEDGDYTEEEETDDEFKVVEAPSKSKAVKVPAFEGTTVREMKAFAKEHKLDFKYTVGTAKEDARASLDALIAAANGE